MQIYAEKLRDIGVLVKKLIMSLAATQGYFK